MHLKCILSIARVAPINESVVCCINKSTGDSQKYAMKMKSNRTVGNIGDTQSTDNCINHITHCVIILKKIITFSKLA